MLFDFFVINHTFDEYRGKNAGCKARFFPRKKHGQIQFVRVIFLGHKHSFVMVQTMIYAPENGELEGRKLWVSKVNIKL